MNLPWWVRAVVRVSISREDREVILGDLEEVHAARVEELGGLGAGIELLGST